MALKRALHRRIHEDGTEEFPILINQSEVNTSTSEHFVSSESDNTKATVMEDADSNGIHLPHS